MNSKLVALFTLFALFSSVLAGSNIQLHVFGASSKWWIALSPIDGAVPTKTLEFRNSGSLEWIPGTFSDSWGYFQLSPPGSNGFVLPISFRLSDANGNKVVAVDAMTSFVADAYIQTQVQFVTATSSPSLVSTVATAAPTVKPTTAPPAQATQKPIGTATIAPTDAATPRPTQAATPVPTQAVTPVTPRPTPTPVPTTTVAPTAAPSLCTASAAVTTAVAPVKMMVPLYVYPGAAWDQLITIAATGVQILAVINPQSGPNPKGPDAAYKNYMAKFKAAGIEMVGYVHTLWGARNTTTVLNEIDMWYNLYPGVNGIFFDEAASEITAVPFYTTVYNAVKGKNWYHVVLNPGAQPHPSYLNISTTIVIFENYASELYNTRFDSWVTCAPNQAAVPSHKYRFSAIIHTAKQTDMPWLVNQSFLRGMGYVYVTDYEGGCCTYNWINTYVMAQGSYMKTMNAAA